MALSPDIQDGIKTYLWEVASYLHTASPASRTEILKDVESHIYEALLVRNTEPTSEDLQAVLSAMPPPASYATECPEGRAESKTSAALVSAGESFGAWLRRFTWQSIVGPLLVLLGFTCFIKGAIMLIFGTSYGSMVHSMSAPSFFESSAAIVRIVGSFLLFLGVAALIGAREAGHGGIDKIRGSNWQRYGFAGAYIAYIVPELVLIALFVVGLIGLPMGAAGCGTAISGLTVLVILGVIDYFVIKYMWIKLSRRDDTLADAR